MRNALAVLLTVVALAQPQPGQHRPPGDGGPTNAVGKPAAWKWTLGGAAGIRLEDNLGTGEARIGLAHDLVNPMLSLLAAHGELYGARLEGQADAGVRLRVISPVARIGIGADYSARAGEVDVVLSASHPIWRGGVVGRGSTVRLDYLPGRDHTAMLGIEWPVLRRIGMGRTRPQRDHVRLEHAPAPSVPAPDQRPDLLSLLRQIGDDVDWIRRLTVPFLDHDGPDNAAAEAAVIAELGRIQNYLAAPAHASAPNAIEHLVRRYHASLDRAFSAAIAGAPDARVTHEGRRVAAYARNVVLTDVLLPYNGLLGQNRRRDSLHGLNGSARARFLRWLHVESSVSPEAQPAVLWVFAELLNALERTRAAAHTQWQDPRFIWLPLQYALLPEQHDTQPELDALIEMATGGRFSDGNHVSYVINEQFQFQLSRTIRAAEDYHVLWTHDVRGVDATGEPDEMAYRQVLKSYMAALIERVRAYDRTGRIPVYMILLDEWFYTVNQGRLWLDLLEDPLYYRLRLPAGYEEWERTIAAAQSELRTAVEQSRLLQAQRRQFGDAWLRDLIKVHVNITNPADPSYWSRAVLPFVPLPDNMMRDHRKIVFYDIGEEDPYRGEAMYTGAGIGEHYANLSWEDRSLLVKGPAVLSLKHAARELLLSQGMRREDVPHPLQPRPLAADYDARVAHARARQSQLIRAMDLHSGTGYASKQVNVAKALLYTLMPPGAVIKIPDSLWSSAFWGSALFGCSLRGGRVLVIAPAAANAPAPKFGALGRSHELLWRLITAQNLLASEIAATGGLLRVGLYDSELQVVDVPGKVRTLITAFGDQPWLRELFGFPDQVYADIEDLARELERLVTLDPTAHEFEFDERPKLHLKANFFASREAWTIMTRREWGQVAADFAFQRIAQVQTRSAAVSSFDEPDDVFIRVGDALVEDWFADLEPAVRERVVFYSIMGSHNQNYRSMAIDGEVAFVMSGWPSIIPYLDLISLVGQSRWLEHTSELERLLPAPSERGRRLARWARLVL